MRDIHVKSKIEINIADGDTITSSKKDILKVILEEAI